MSAAFFLFLPATDINSTGLKFNTVSWVVEDINGDLKLASGTLDDAASASLQRNVTVVVPGEKVLFLSAVVPGKNIQRVQQAIPYVLEDNVIDDVDDLHFAISKKTLDSSDNKYNVSIINKDYFESVIEVLEKVDVFADVMIADYFLLKDDTLFFDGERILCNSEDVKFSSEIDSVVELGSELISDKKKLKLINCNQSLDENNLLKTFVENAKLVEEQLNLHPLLFLVKNNPNNNINLLQANYKKKKDWSQTGKAWLPATVLLLLWLVIQAGVFVFDYIKLSKQSRALNSEITKIYKNTFPQSRRIIDAKAQMQQKLLSFRKRKGQSGRGFTEMLSNSASILSKMKGVEIKSLRYYDGKINLEIKIPTLQMLNKLSELLNKEKGYQVEIQNASSGKESVVARLQIIGEES